MTKKIVLATVTLLMASAILLVSVLRSASVRYDFIASSNTHSLSDGVEFQKLGAMNINYFLPSPGSVLPNSMLWPVKAARDKLWITLTTNMSKKAELNLLFADKRLATAKIMFEKGESEVGFTTLTKAEKYLELASNMETELRKSGVDTTEFAERLVNASLKHRQVVEEILLLAPDDAKSLITQTGSYAKVVYNEKINVIIEADRPIVINPFDSN